jgi:murein DD-endopeptidase MepM/ murein hydrolase activator NlpD
MALQNTLLQNSISLGKISKSFESFGKGLTSATKTSSNIALSLDIGNRKKEQAILKRRELFDTRRSAVERKERESVVEAGQLGSLVSTASRTISGSTKGFLGRVMDFVGTIVLGWVLTNLPVIIKSVGQLIGRIQRAYGLLTRWYDDTTEFFSTFTEELSSIGKSITGASLFDASPEQKQMDEATKKVDKGTSELTSDYNRMAEKFKRFDIVKEIKKLLGFETEENELTTNPDQTVNQQSPQVTYPASQSYDAEKLTNLARSVGIPEEKVSTMVAIALAESGGDPTIDTVKSGSDPDKKNEFSLGLWQINMLGRMGEERRKQFGISSNEELYDPVVNAKAALAILNSQGLGAWGAYTNNSYKDYLPAAQASFEKVKDTKPIQIEYKKKSPPAQQLSKRAAINPSTRYRKGDDVSFIGAPATITDLPGSPRPHGSHGGIDIGVDPNLFIALTVDAEVVGVADGGNYGKVIDIWVPSMGIQLRFAHCNSFVHATAGKKLPAGTSFATTGSTGRSSGPHIHLEADTVRGQMRYGGNKNPAPYVSLIKLTTAKVEGQKTAANLTPPSKSNPNSFTPPSRNIAQNFNRPQKQPTVIQSPDSQTGPAQSASRYNPPGSSMPQGSINIASSSGGLNITDLLIHELAQV